MRCEKLLMESEILKDEVLSRIEGTDNQAQEMSEQTHCWPKSWPESYQNVCVEAVSKSFILRAREVLTRDSSIEGLIFDRFATVALL
jgi:hypothetical protein